VGWKEEAACKGKGVTLFFNRRTPAERDSVIELCNSCPVKKQCLVYALDFEKTDSLRIGIWGGLNPNERAEYESRNAK
jgi:hypothetical protein